MTRREIYLLPLLLSLYTAGSGVLSKVKLLNQWRGRPVSGGGGGGVNGLVTAEVLS